MSIRKALLIGINYVGTSSELNGCINDCENLERFLKENKNFTSTEITMMHDRQRGELYPTKANITKQLQLLVDFAKKNSRKTVNLFVSYSGHGSYLRDRNGDELDGKDEVLCPVDYEKSGFITDDYLKASFVSLLPKNVTATVLIDACHSGTVLDLKFDYAVNKMGTYQCHTNLSQTGCNLVMISGCMDNQTSSDAYLKDNKNSKYEYQGAMTASFLESWNSECTFNSLITNMRASLKKGGFEQIPQLSSGRYININNRFLL